jgi:hypothetical protein
MPPVSHPWLEDDLSEAIVNRVRAVFRRQGFEGTVEEIRSGQSVEEGVPLLELRLFDWRTTHTGMVRMTLSAEAIDADGASTAMGVFSSSDFLQGARSRFELAHAFRSVADDVVKDLWRKIEKKGGWSVLFAAHPGGSPEA